MCPCEPRSISCLGVTAASTLSQPTNNQRQLIAGPTAVGSTSCRGERGGQQGGTGEASSDKVLEGLPGQRRVARVLLHGKWKGGGLRCGEHAESSWDLLI